MKEIINMIKAGTGELELAKKWGNWKSNRSYL